MVNNKLHAAIILEDDVELEAQFKSKTESLYNKDPINYDWPDVLLLGHCHTSFRNLDHENHHPIRTVRAFACTHSYVVTYSGAQKLLKYLDHNPFHFEKAVDNALEILQQKGLITIKALVKPISRQLPRALINDDNVSGTVSMFDSSYLFNYVLFDF